MQDIAFGIAGLGNIGPRHLAVLEGTPGARITAVCDIDEDKCKQYSLLYGGVAYFTDFSKMLNEAKIDVVNICTPHHLHSSMTVMALDSGRHVLVEKPMALTSIEADKMLEASIRSGRRLMVVKQNRYNVPIVLARKALEEGRLGRVFMVQCNVLWNRHDGYYTESPWRGRKAMEGGTLYTQVSHFIDLLIWWFGDVIGAQACISNKNHTIETEDCGTAEILFSSEVMGTIMWTTCVHDSNYEGSITIIGEYGTIKIGGSYLNKIEYWDVRDYPLPPDVQFVDKPNSYGKYQGTSSNHDKVIRDLIGDLISGGSSVVDGKEAQRTVRAIELIYAKTGVNPPDPPRLS
jgi:predicted dehydrogenase